jgi:hypothetical protein
MRRMIHAALAAGALVAGLLAMPSLSTGAGAAEVPADSQVMPYVGQDRVHAVLDTIAIPQMGALAPAPSILCGAGVCGNVRNIGAKTVLVNGAQVAPGQTSRSQGVLNATNVTTTGGWSGLYIYQWYANGGHPFTVSHGCYFMGGKAVPLGRADWWVQPVTGCPIGG